MDKVGVKELRQLRAVKTDPAGIEARFRCVDLGPAERARVLALKDLITGLAPGLTESFFTFLGGLPESTGLMNDPKALNETRLLKQEHLVAMVAGDYGAAYVQQRVKLGALYSAVGLEMRAFLGAYHHLMREIGLAVMARFKDAPDEGFQNFMALKKIAFFDLGIIVDALIFENQRIIGLQSEAIRELSTPVLRIAERLLLLPLIGVMDTQRARQVTDGLLAAIRLHRAKAFVIDVTGVPVIDSKVCDHLLRAVTSARLMGATGIVSGISSDVAQSLVKIGFDPAKFNTVSDLQRAIQEAARLLATDERTAGPGLAGAGDPLYPPS